MQWPPLTGQPAEEVHGIVMHVPPAPHWPLLEHGVTPSLEQSFWLQVPNVLAHCAEEAHALPAGLVH